MKDAETKRTTPGSKRVLLLELARDGTVGGSHHCLLTIARTLDRDRYQPVAAFYQDNAVADLLRHEAIETHILEPPQTGGSTAPPSTGIHLARKVRSAWRTYVRGPSIHRAWLRRLRIDLLHQNNSVGLGAEWLLAGRAARIPVLVHQRGFIFGGRRERFVNDPRADRVIAISRAVERALREKTRVPASRIVQIWDSLDTDRFVPLSPERRALVRADLGVEPDRLLLGMAGNIKEWKGQLVVVEALAKLAAADRARVRCLFFGAVSDRSEDRAYARRVEDRIRDAGLAEVVAVAGFKPSMAEIYAAMDLLVHASIDPEPFGMVLVEAMSCGTPVVATRGGGPDDIVAPDATGWLWEPGNADDLASRLVEVLRTKGRLESMRAAARARACTHFSVRAALPRLQAVYDDLLVRDLP